MMPPSGPANPGKPKKETYKRRCSRCAGSGRASCEICNGRREVFRGVDIFGKQEFTRCDGCFGLGTRRCPVCNGEGFIG